MATFVRVVEKGSFASAANDLLLTPSAVSKTVTRLEQRLGVQLLTRTTRRLVLTKEGETYLLRCREILEAIEEAEAEITKSGAVPQGNIRVSAGTALGRLQLARLLPDFLDAFPEITVDLRISDQRVDLVAERVDVALRWGKLSDSTLVARKIVDGKRVICASPRYLEKSGTPREPSDLLHHNCILMSDMAELARWPFHSKTGVEHVQVNGNVTTDNADVVHDLAIAGHGIVHMVDIHVTESIRNGLLVPLLTKEHAVEPIPIWALMPPGRNQLPRVRVFLDFLVDRFVKLTS
jgi:DNA-binding transcriptional LysR family regulator